MEIIKLNAIDSTNSFMRQLCAKQEVEDFTAVMAERQLNGRGQRGTVWLSEAGKNLTCTVYKRLQGIPAEDGFYVSMATSLAISAALKSMGIPRIMIKWPNDILSEDKKICGILIENIIRNNVLEASLIGIGINVNQMRFPNLPHAASLKMILGRYIQVEEVLNIILQHLKEHFGMLEEGDFYSITQSYESQMYRKDKPSSFKSPEGEIFPGYIKGVDPSGAIKIQLEDDIVKSFGMKEIQLMF